MTRTYLDANILITAFRGQNEDDVAACMRVLDDDSRVFVSSAFLKLELMPMPAYHRQVLESNYYDCFFAKVSEWLAVEDNTIEAALEEACQHGISAMDALHVVAAHRLHADVLVTAEKQDKAMYRTSLLRISSLDEYRS
jgi:predicted nucleic acid-binding protein